MRYDPIAYFVDVTGIGQCILDEMTLQGIEHPKRVCVPVPGDIAWDKCECGQLAITTTRVYPARTFPTESVDDGTQGNCGPGYLVTELVIALHRCVPVLDNNGKAPSCEKLRNASLEMYRDAAAVRKAVSCCVRTLRNTGRIVEFQVNATTYEGPQGGCAGSSLTVLLGYIGQCCG